MSGRVAIWYAAAGVLAAAAVPVAALTVPAYSSGETIVEANGAGALIPSSIPLAVALAVTLLLARRCRTGSARTLTTAWCLVAALGVFAVVSGFSIGLWVVPSVVLLALSARATPGATLRAPA